MLSFAGATLVNIPDAAVKRIPNRRADDHDHHDDSDAEPHAVSDHDSDHDDHEYYEPNYEEPLEPQVIAEAPHFDKTFESEEIKETLAMIEYKMAEVNELMKECIEQEFAADLMADKDQVMTECVGLTYQILFFNYHEGLVRVKQIFLELLKEKLATLSEQYIDETEFFLDVLEEFVDKDFALKESLEIAKSTSKYYVSPRFFDSLLEIAEPEINAFDTLHKKLRKDRTAIQDLMDEKVREREKYLAGLKGEVTQLETVVDPHVEEHHDELPLAHEIYDDYHGPEHEAEELHEEEYHEPDHGHDDEELDLPEEEELSHFPLAGPEEALGETEEGGEGGYGGGEGGHGGKESAGGEEAGGEGGDEERPMGPRQKVAAPESGDERRRRMKMAQRRPYKDI